MNKSNYYTNNSAFLKWAIFIITIFSIIICILLYKPLDYLSGLVNGALIDNNLGFLVFIGYGFQPLTFSAAFGILWLLFDKLIWKLFAKFGLLLNINGTWCGVLESDPNNNYPNGKTMFVVMIIKQSFSRINIHCYFSDKKNSYTGSSDSIGYNFNISELNGHTCISYSYTNCKQDNKSPDNEHLGFNYYYYDNNVLNGHYGTFRSSGRTGGAIKLNKKNSKTRYSDSIWIKENFD